MKNGKKLALPDEEDATEEQLDDTEEVLATPEAALLSESLPDPDEFSRISPF